MSAGPLSSVAGLWTYAFPLFLLGDATALWLVWVSLVWAWPRLPPFFEPTHRDRSWQEGPATAIDADLRAGRISSAIDYARFRVARALRVHYGLPAGSGAPGWLGGRSLPAEADALRQLHRTLSRAYELASRAESSADDFLTRRFRGAWAEQARALFADALPRLEATLPPLEVGW